MSASARLAELGIVLPQVVSPVGSYVPAVHHGGLVYTSGQLPMVDGVLVAQGRLGDGVTPEQGAACARAATLNALAAVAGVCGGIDNVQRVVRVVGYVASSPDFVGQPGVMNAGSDLLFDIFGESGRHVRSAIGVASLPLGAPVEVELVVAVRG